MEEHMDTFSVGQASQTHSYTRNVVPTSIGEFREVSHLWYSGNIPAAREDSGSKNAMTYYDCKNILLLIEIFSHYVSIDIKKGSKRGEHMLAVFSV